MSSQPTVDEAPPALPPRSAQRDSCGSPQISPVQPVHPTTAASSSIDPTAPPVPDKTATAQPAQQPTQAQQVQQVQSLFPNAAPAETIKTRREELKEGDRHWQWKIAFRAAAIIVGLIGIGCAAWIVAHFTSNYEAAYYFDDEWTIPWTLITFVLSVVWSAACIITFFTRKPTAPVHPGAQVGVDLILWLGFLTTGLFAILGTLSVGDWGSDGQLGYSSSGDGYYVRGSDDVWTWHASQSSSYWGEDRPCNSTSSRYSTFSSCEEQDAFVNALWKQNVMRYNIDLTVTVCQFLALLFHFILFVWACVDTHRRNSRSVSKDAEKLAAEIVMNMVNTGAIIPAPGQAHFRPAMPMSQQAAPMGFVYPQQQFPQQFQQYQQYPQHYPPQQYPTTVAQGKAPVPQPTVASSSNEKGAGPRYA